MRGHRQAVGGRRGAEQEVQRGAQLGGQRVQHAHRRGGQPPLDLRNEAGRALGAAGEFPHRQAPLLAYLAQPGAKFRAGIERTHGPRNPAGRLTATLYIRLIRLYTGRHARGSPDGRAHPARARPAPHACPRADERRLRAARRLRPAALLPARPGHGRAGGQRPRRAAGLRQQQHPLPHRRGDRRVDQGQAVPVRAVHPHRRAVPLGLRLGRRAPPDVLPLAQARALHRLLHHHARRHRARGRARRQGGGGDQGPPRRHRGGGHAGRGRLRRDCPRCSNCSGRASRCATGSRSCWTPGSSSRPTRSPC